MTSSRIITILLVILFPDQVLRLFLHNVAWTIPIAKVIEVQVVPAE